MSENAEREMDITIMAATDADDLSEVDDAAVSPFEGEGADDGIGAPTLQAAPLSSQSGPA